jgi:hypothetical protein
MSNCSINHVDTRESGVAETGEVRSIARYICVCGW